MIVSNFGLFIYFQYNCVLTNVFGDKKILKYVFFYFQYYVWNYIINGDNIYFVSDINISG
jgi:hypothetical protein